MNKRKIDTRALILTAFAVFVIIALYKQMGRLKPPVPAELEKLQGRRIAIIDSAYVNLPLRFICRMPSALWHMTLESTDTCAIEVDPNLSLFSQIRWLMSAERFRGPDRLAGCRVGILPRQDRHIMDIANSLMANLFDRDGSEIRSEIIQPVTAPAHPVLKGAYFLILLPESENQSFVRLVCVLPRKPWIYIVECRTPEKHYPIVRDELEGIVRRFFPLPATFLEDSKR